ncbi:recombinase family protein [Paenibacillus solisilvae]|uniref:Recombinase family protein n=1 Tax=Paenibacillus solisilvae TaxID=2486751 RepID=A0ABW0VT40_9BACL
MAVSTNEFPSVSKQNKIMVAAYCRVSTGSEEQETSFKNQRSYFEREISKSKDLTLYRVYADRGITGTSLNRREEFSRMLYDAGLDETKINNNKSVFTASHREPQFQQIHVKGTSRLARNVLVIDVLRELLKMGVHVYFLDINLKFDSIDKEFMLNLFLNFSQQESIDKSAKTRFGLAESARKGVIYTNNKIWGYQYSKDTRELTIVEEEATVVRKVFEMYAEGLGIRRIMNYLEENGIRSRQGKPFVPSFIKRMLSNEKYYGTLVRNKYNTGTVFNKITPKVKDSDEWQVFENRVPVIISKELFDKCNAIRSGKVNYVNQKGIHKGVSDLAGKIFCGKCGSSYTRNLDQGRAFYNCSTKKTKGTKHCDNINVQESAINAQLDDIATNGLIAVFASQKDKQINAFRSQIEALQNRIDAPAVEELNAKTVEMAELDNEEATLVRLVVKGQVKESLFDELKRDIDAKKEAIQSQINALARTNEDIIKEIEVLESKIAKLDALTVKDEYSREEILDLISKFVITSETVPYITKKEKRLSSKTNPVITYELNIFDDIMRI